ncbi:MAG: PilT/PilU family type 4a pilus ATPase [Oscillospiraceae bacterium]|nr:PilT/PilU family type 4a pilus ATPase [Candidatus Limimonas coprohippi]
MDLLTLLKGAVEQQASDIFVITSLPLSYKVNGIIAPVAGEENERVSVASARSLVEEMYDTAGRPMDKLLKTGDDDFSLAISGLSRFRVSTYKQRGSLAAVIRLVSFDIPNYEELGIPESVMSIAEKTKGLVLVTGPAGGGKSTTLACIIDRINKTRNGHIITLEEPLEYLHRNNKCVISQREIGSDSEDYVAALRACLRQAPDVILVGEMRDYETIKTAMTAAETGHLVISTLHTVGAANTIDRVIDVFPPNQQQQIRVQLAQLLQCVVSQQLIPTVDGSLTPAFEVMNLNSAIRNMIRESKVHQIDSIISTSAAEGMVAMDSSIYDLFNAGIISEANAIKFASNADLLKKKIALKK